MKQRDLGITCEFSAATDLVEPGRSLRRSDHALELIAHGEIDDLQDGLLRNLCVSAMFLDRTDPE